MVALVAVGDRGRMIACCLPPLLLPLLLLT
jgi:hypothetical protein